MERQHTACESKSQRRMGRRSRIASMKQRRHHEEGSTAHPRWLEPECAPLSLRKRELPLLSAPRQMSFRQRRRSAPTRSTERGYSLCCRRSGAAASAAAAAASPAPAGSAA
eukprot:3082265-Pleurochrysis_carterae.AAC.1